MLVVGAVLLGLAGAFVVVVTLLSAVQTVVVPRAAPVKITRWVFLAIGAVFTVIGRRRADYYTRDRVMALYAPLSLLILPVVWLLLVLLGYAGVFWAVGIRPWSAALLESGSSLFTLGFKAPDTLGFGWLVFSEATLGLGLLALLISYLPSIYASYSRREVMVTGLETQAGTPASAVELLERLVRIDGVGELADSWEEWARWFADIEETHCSTPSLVHFRSPQPDRSWVTATGAVLDSAALVASTFDLPRQPNAELCIRAGYLALRRIGDFFGMPYDPDPSPTDPISVQRAEYDEVCDRLLAAGARLRPDRDQTWRDFVGWRVNYDGVLLRFAALTMAPPAPWSSDRAVPFRPRTIARGRHVFRT